MIRHLLPVSALLMGSGLLLFAGGMNSLILPIRGALEGFQRGVAGPSGRRLGRGLCGRVHPDAAAGRQCRAYPRLRGDVGLRGGGGAGLAPADHALGVDPAARYLGLLLRRGGDDRRKLAERTGRAGLARAHLRALHDGQPGGLDRGSDGADAGRCQGDHLLRAGGDLLLPGAGADGDVDHRHAQAAGQRQAGSRRSLAQLAGGGGRGVLHRDLEQRLRHSLGCLCRRGGAGAGLSGALRQPAGAGRGGVADPHRDAVGPDGPPRRSGRGCGGGADHRPGVHPAAPGRPDRQPGPGGAFWGVDLRDVSDHHRPCQRPCARRLFHPDQRRVADDLRAGLDRRADRGRGRHVAARRGRAVHDLRQRAPGVDRLHALADRLACGGRSGDKAAFVPAPAGRATTPETAALAKGEAPAAEADGASPAPVSPV